MAKYTKYKGKRERGLILKMEYPRSLFDILQNGILKMKLEHKILLAGAVTICSFDALASIALNQFNFRYALLAPVSFIIYIAYGFIGCNMVNFRTGIITAAAVGFFDSTIGWETSILLHANVDKIDKLENNPTPLVWIITSILVTGTGALCGLIGAWLAKVTKKKAEIGGTSGA